LLGTNSNNKTQYITQVALGFDVNLLYRNIDPRMITTMDQKQIEHAHNFMTSNINKNDLICFFNHNSLYYKIPETDLKKIDISSPQYKEL